MVIKKRLTQDPTDDFEFWCVQKGDERVVGRYSGLITTYYTMEFSDSFENAIVATVNHDGDSNFTGAICGPSFEQILIIWRDFLNKIWRLEINDVILQAISIHFQK